MMNIIRSICLIPLLIFVQPTYQVLYSCDSSVACGCSVKPASVSRIVGGEAAGVATWGWAVSISIDDIYLCGGSIISNSWIITAAHCLYSQENSKIIVYAGSNMRWSGSQNHTVSQVILHPNYVDATYSNDIALLKLSDPLNMSDPNISPICLPLVSSVNIASGEWPLVDTTVVAIGWGRLSEGGPAPENLQQVTLQTVSYEAPSCSRVIHDKDIQFCATGSGGTKDACQGDSGGPLMMFTPNNQWILVGLTSFGTGCARVGYAGVYTRVAAYQTWIQSYTHDSRWIAMNSHANIISTPIDGLFFSLIPVLLLVIFCK